MQHFLPLIETAQHRFSRQLEANLKQSTPTPATYQRCLSIQYHMASSAQRHLMFAAAHQDVDNLIALRKFLIDFADQQRLYAAIAEDDLRKANLDLLAEPFDVMLWNAYFTITAVERPFVRLGAACVFERILASVLRPLIPKACAAPFLNRDNSKLLRLYLRQKPAQDTKMVAVLSDASLFDCQLNDLEEGARQGTVMYLRMAEWALNTDTMAHFANRKVGPVSEPIVLNATSSVLREVESLDAEFNRIWAKFA